MALSKHPLSPASQALANVPLDRGVVAVLASSFRVIQERRGDFAEGFYSRLFAAHPALRSMFPADMTAQKSKLLDTLAAVIAHLADPAANLHRIQELGRRHKGYGARAEHFPIVVSMMLASMAEVAASDWNPAVEAEWRRALELVSQVMIQAGRGPPHVTSTQK
jgi:hemoglobin-like flavoprotein